jgi:hypothetical protein
VLSEYHINEKILSAPLLFYCDDDYNDNDNNNNNNDDDHGNKNTGGC